MSQPTLPIRVKNWCWDFISQISGDDADERRLRLLARHDAELRERQTRLIQLRQRIERLKARDATIPLAKRGLLRDKIAKLELVYQKRVATFRQIRKQRGELIAN